MIDALELEYIDTATFAKLLKVTPSTVRVKQHRGELPEPMTKKINGGTVWKTETVREFLKPKPTTPCRASAYAQINEALPSVIDLFSGCGGLSLGFQQAGFKLLEGYDNWQPAVDTYNANLNHPATKLDLGDVEQTIAELSKFQGKSEFPAIIGGPPCQDFSSAGKRIEGSRADLTEKYASIITTFMPPFFLMENVARAKSSNAFKNALRIMEEAGYHIHHEVIDASLCGVPQRRKRLITIGTHSEPITNEIFERIHRTMSKQPTTVRDWFGDTLKTETYYRHPRSYARRGIFSIDEPSPTIRGVNRPIPTGYPGHPGDAGPISQTRPLTTRERASIQTFPDDFHFVSSKTDTEQMIGNAVPVELAHFIARAIADTLSQQ